MTAFKDHFSGHASNYARYRPVYPPELFEYLASLCDIRETAWDCGTGNGQAAVELAPYFESVIASDPSEAQISNALPHPKVEYRVMPAERTDMLSGSLDLITVAQAMHWFDTDLFYEEVRRILKPSGIFTMWCYKFFEAAPEVDESVQRFYHEVVYEFWPPERKKVEDFYQSIPFPFNRIETPQFYMAQHWNLDDLMGYVYTWSATQRYLKKNDAGTLNDLRAELTGIWPTSADEEITFRWPIYLFAGQQ